MDTEELKEELLKKTEYVEQLITECTQLKEEWEERIREATEVRDNFRLLMQQMAIENKENDE